jgi:ssDNA-binding Zn-finger/Zn-ribbon topoisomerase 1
MNTALPESIARRDWMPIVCTDDEITSWSKFFHTYERCPVCKNDLSTNGRGKWRCPKCGWKETRKVRETTWQS